MGAVVWGVGVSVVGRPGQQMHRRHRALQQHQGAQQTDQADGGQGQAGHKGVRRWRWVKCTLGGIGVACRVFARGVVAAALQYHGAMTAVPDPTAEPTPTAQSVDAAAPPSTDATKASDEVVDEEERRRKALARLMMRISEQADFPSLKDSIGTIQKITRSDRAHLNQLSDLVLGDVALTGKLLRIINAAFYSSAGGGSITSMQRAVALMGFESVGMLAASLMLFERVPKGRDGEAVRHACSRALLSGLLAQQLCHSRKHAESVYLTALFMNLGQMLVAMHFPADARTIKKKADDAVASLQRQAEANAALHTGAVKDKPTGPSNRQIHEIKQKAAREVIGLTLEELGSEVARQWGWPDALASQLRCLYPSDPEREPGDEEYMRVLCTASSDLSVALHALPKVGKPEELVAARDACMRQFGESLGVVLRVDPESLPALGELAMEQWATLAEFLGIKPDANGVVATSSANAIVFQAKKPPALKGPDRITQGLAHALNGLKEAADSAAPLEEVIEQMMVDLVEALSLQRVIVCLRDPVHGDLKGRAGNGLRAPAVTATFHVPLGGSQDLFSVLCINAKDALVADAGDPVVAKRLPPWFLQKVGARTFVLLPLASHATVHGLIYVDRQMAGSLVLSESELKLLKSVRDHLLVAMDRRGLTPMA